MQFLDAEFMTARDKELTLKAWERFLKGGCQERDFTARLYGHLVQHCAFIAHVNHNGFYATYFTKPVQIQLFLSQFTGTKESVEHGPYIDWIGHPLEYSDINMAMCGVAEKYAPELVQRANKVERARDLAEAQRLADKLGYKLVPE